MSQADGSLPAAAALDEQIRIHERMIKVFQQAAELPVTDLERRKLVGRVACAGAMLARC